MHVPRNTLIRMLSQIKTLQGKIEMEVLGSLAGVMLRMVILLGEASSDENASSQKEVEEMSTAIMKLGKSSTVMQTVLLRSVQDLLVKLRLHKTPADAATLIQRQGESFPFSAVD